MEIRRHINPKYLLRPVLAGLALFAAAVPAFAEEVTIKPGMGVTVSCSNAPAYGLTDIGPHARIYVNATNLRTAVTRPVDGTWLYVGKLHAESSDPNESRGYRVVGFSSDPSSFTANMDGYINSIRNQDTAPNGKVEPIRFNPGDVIGIQIRRGPYTESFPVTEYVIDTSVNIPNCFADSPVQGEPVYTKPTETANPIVLQPVYSEYTVTQGDSVWRVLSRQVQVSEKKTGIKLSPNQNLVVVNALKNLTVNKNGRNLTLIHPDDRIQLPLNEAINVLVRNQAADSSSSSDKLDQLISDLVIGIANPPQDFATNKVYKIRLAELQSALEAKLTIEKYSTK